MPEAQKGKQFHILSAASLPDQNAMAEALVAVAADNRAYLEDVRRGRAIALLISRDGELAHYCFLFLRNKTACLLGLRRNTALIANMWTAPHFRGQGLQGEAVLAGAAIASRFGFERVVAETAPDNLASKRGLSKGGMRRLGRVQLIVVFNVLVLRWRRPKPISLLGLCFQ